MNTVNSADWSGWILINLITISFLLSFPCRSYFFFLFFFFFLWWWHSILREKWIWIIYEEPTQLNPIDINIIYINKKKSENYIMIITDKKKKKKETNDWRAMVYIQIYSKVYDFVAQKAIDCSQNWWVARLVLC